MTARPKHIHKPVIVAPPRQPRVVVLTAGQQFDALNAEVQIDLIDRTATANLTVNGINQRIDRHYGFFPAPARRIVNHGPGAITVTFDLPNHP